MAQGFNWDGEKYTEGGGGGPFIKKDDFNRIVYAPDGDGAVVSITDIREGVSTYVDPAKPNRGPQPQWLIDFIGPDGEEYTKGVTMTNDERNARLRRFKATIEATGEPVESSPFYVGSRIEFGPPRR